MTDPLILEATDVHHAYRAGSVESPVLHGINLALRRGEFALVMGPSGCGKTTLLHILGLMMQPTRGAVRIDGRETTGLGDAERTALRGRAIGFVFQRFNLLPALSAEQNVALAMKLRGQSPNGRPRAVLERFGLGPKRGSKPGALSIGEQQRVAIARAVACAPAILLADEPTGNLDSASANAVLDLLTELNKELRLTVLMITHNEHLISRADRVLTMNDGRLV